MVMLQYLYHTFNLVSPQLPYCRWRTVYVQQGESFRAKQQLKTNRTRAATVKKGKKKKPDVQSSYQFFLLLLSVDFFPELLLGMLSPSSLTQSYGELEILVCAVTLPTAQ